MNQRQKLFVTAIATLILATILAAPLLAPQNQPEDGKLKVVATFYPLTFFAQQIGGEQVTVKQLIPDNTEVHNWQPSLADILALDKADIIIYNGASLDHWFETDVLAVIDSSSKLIVESTKGMKLLEAKTKHSDEHELVDPHTWISPYNALQQAQNIYEALIQKDPAHREYYSEHWQKLKTRLEDLDNRYMTELSTKKKEDIFVAHAAFGYLADRYGFRQHGVIGISADEQPSAQVYANLAEMMVEHDVYVVYVDPVYPDESAQTLKNELKRLSARNVEVLKLYFMLGEIDGLDYFGQLEKNLENLKIGLEAKLG